SPALLAFGTALAGIGYCLAGASAGVGLLMIALFVSGLGSSTQHPLASALVAHAFAGARSMQAIGTYNFSGDVGKMTVPAAAALLLAFMDWRSVLALLGAVGVLAGTVIFLVTPAPTAQSAASQPADEKQFRERATPRRRMAFPVLVAIGVIDSATRMGFLLFLPFLLTDKGAGLPTLGFALTL